jgi:hypothetical protein
MSPKRGKRKFIPESNLIFFSVQETVHIKKKKVSVKTGTFLVHIHGTLSQSRKAD